MKNTLKFFTICQICCHFQSLVCTQGLVERHLIQSSPWVVQHTNMPLLARPSLSSRDASAADLEGQGPAVLAPSSCIPWCLGDEQGPGSVASSLQAASRRVFLRRAERPTGSSGRVPSPWQVSWIFRVGMATACQDLPLAKRDLSYPVFP